MIVDMLYQLPAPLALLVVLLFCVGVWVFFIETGKYMR